MEEKTFTTYVQDKIKAIDLERLASESNVVRIGQFIAELAQLLTRINQELASRQAAYNFKLQAIISLETKSVAHARVQVDASEEARRLLECRLLKESVVEMVRSLKYLARSMQEELNHS